jgi:hypothetical protein
LGFAIMSGNYPGTYTKAGNVWLFNGTPIQAPQATLVMDSGIHVRKIDGTDPLRFATGKGTYFIPPGMHSVEVSYEDRAV